MKGCQENRPVPVPRQHHGDGGPEPNARLGRRLGYLCKNHVFLRNGLQFAVWAKDRLKRLLCPPLSGKQGESVPKGTWGRT